MGVNISALAAYGNPVRLYGLGNGTASGDEVAVDSPNLYEIDISTGAATLIGPLGPGVGQYATRAAWLLTMTGSFGPSPTGAQLILPQPGHAD